EANAGVGLLTDAEIILRALRERFAFERNDALERPCVLAEIERQDKAASAEQFRRRHAMRAGESFGGAFGEPCVAAQAAVRMFGDEQRNKPFALCLDDEAAVCLQQ